MTPLYNRVLVQDISEDYSNKLLRHHISKNWEQNRKGTIVAAGPDCTEVSAGRIVLFPKDQSKVIWVKGQKLYQIREDFIWGFLD